VDRAGDLVDQAGDLVDRAGDLVDAKKNLPAKKSLDNMRLIMLRSEV